MEWNRQTVLVTGAGGFIGSHLTERLVALGARTRAFVHYNASSSWGWLDHSTVKSDLDVRLGDIRDRDSLKEAMRGVDIVFHLAALIAIPYSYATPLSYVRTNVEGTGNVLLEAREAGVKRILHTSTSEVYGTARTVPIDELHPLQGQSPYAASKIGADKLAESFHLSYGLPIITIRPFNTFGPRQSARAVIPAIMSQCLSGGKVRLGNLKPTRDLNFVANTVDGYVKAAVAPDAVGRTLNLGSGREISIGDLVHTIARLVGREIEIEQEAVRLRPGASEVERLLACDTLARNILGWEPSISLEEGLKITLEWLQQNLHRYRPSAYNV